jgi:DNA-directed RNA polymerase subunit RPC12/RpoP
MILSFIPLFVLCIVFCCLFSVAAIIFFIIWIVSFFRSRLQKQCAECGAQVQSWVVFCPHCRKKILTRHPPLKRSKLFLTLSVVSLILMILSIVGIAFSANNLGMGTSVVTQNATNFNQSSTSSSWTITFERVTGGVMSKNILIKDSKHETLHIKYRIGSGSARVDLKEGEERNDINLSGSSDDASIDLSGYNNGSAKLSLEIRNASDANIYIWWE